MNKITAAECSDGAIPSGPSEYRRTVATYTGSDFVDCLIDDAKHYNGPRRLERCLGACWAIGEYMARVPIHETTLQAAIDDMLSGCGLKSPERPIWSSAGGVYLVVAALDARKAAERALFRQEVAGLLLDRPSSSPGQWVEDQVDEARGMDSGLCGREVVEILCEASGATLEPEHFVRLTTRAERECEGWRPNGEGVEGEIVLGDNVVALRAQRWVTERPVPTCSRPEKAWAEPLQWKSPIGAEVEVSGLNSASDANAPLVANDDPPAPVGILRHIDINFDDEADLAAPRWRVQGLFPEQGLAMLYGESQAGKTFLANSLAVSTAMGLKWFGRRVERSAVLFIAAEGGKSVGPRLRAADRRAKQARIAENLVRTSQGEETLAGSAPIRLVVESPDLSRGGQPEKLVATVRRFAVDCINKGEPLGLVIVDTWHAVLAGGDEDKAADAGVALAPLRELAERFGLLVLILHHPGKDLERGPRGSGSLYNAMDAVVELATPGISGAKAKRAEVVRVATATKVRDGDAGGGFTYRLGIVPMGTDQYGEPWTTCVVEPIKHELGEEADNPGGAPTPTAREVLDILLAHDARGAGKAIMSDVVRGAFANPRRAKNVPSNTIDQAWGRAIKDLKTKKLICTGAAESQLWLPDDNDKQ